MCPLFNKKNEMKRLIFILCLLPLLNFGQAVKFMNTCVITTDSTFTIPVPEQEDYQYDLGIQVEWYGLAGTLDGEIILKHTMAGDTITCEYGTDMNELWDSATGYTYFELYEVTATSIQLFFDINSITTGTVNAWVIYKRKR
jgi:hypothetical protein